jgi:hypothetical protein
MKNSFLIFIATLGFFIAEAQSDMIKKVFRLLPAGKVFDLTVATRDSMLLGKTYYPAENDSTEIVAYNYGMSEKVKDYMYVSMSFETRQRATSMIEIRSFKTISGDNLILVSRSGGLPWGLYHQNDLSTFLFSSNKKLTPYKKKIFPATDEKIFIKPGIPDSLKKKLMDGSNMAFDLSNEKVSLGLNNDYITENKTLKKWLKGNTVSFDWIKDHFVISKMEFQ